ncbi:MAG: hypothetical protein JWN48_1575 [Myxococcaceae bacterium]|nr:hypothetical protein [Myxococcaceae bacterium]
MQKISVVQGDAGQVGILDEESSAALSVRLEDGRHVAVSREELEPLADGTVLLKTPLAQLEQAPVLASVTVPIQGGETPQSDSVTIPRVEEQLTIEKATHVRGSVRVHVVPTEREQLVSIPVADTQTEVRRVAIGRIVEVAPPVREEGDTVIVPVMEEVLVVEKRLLLREEVHIVRQQTTRLEERAVTLRSERIEVSREGE